MFGQNFAVVIVIAFPVFLWFSIFYAFAPVVWATTTNFLLKIFRN